MINSTLPIPKPRMSEAEESELPSEAPLKKLPAQAEAMKCFCRIRPNDKNDIFKIVEGSEDKNLSIRIEPTILQKCGGVSSFTFSKVFSESSSQEDVFQFTCNNLIEDIFKAKKGGLIFTYGMTNAGKTFTVIGKPDNPGILPLSLKKIYDSIEAMENKPKVSCNFIEIYNEEIFDLLSSDPKNPNFKKKVYVKEREKRFIVQDITNIKIETLDDFSEALNRGILKKAHSSTSLNQNSSRSHTIFKIIVSFPNQIKKNEIEYHEVSLSIVDLAGSERQKRTEAQGKELIEACKINQSLSVLGKCMEALRHNSLFVNKKIVPFRESKLTMLFQEYFQGDQNIIMITNINPRREDFEETMRALTYSCVAKEIKPIKSKIVTFAKKREIVKTEELEESMTDEKNICRNLNEVFSETKGTDYENHGINQLSFSEGRSSMFLKDEIESIRADLEAYKKRYDESQNLLLEYEKKMDLVINKYEELKGELKNREQYGRIEAAREILSGLSTRPSLVGGMFQIDQENREINLQHENQLEQLNVMNLPMNYDKEYKKINIIMVQPNFNEIKFSSEIMPSCNENFAFEGKKESTVLININNSNNQSIESKVEINTEEVVKKEENKGKKGKKINNTSFRESLSHNDTTITKNDISSLDESTFSEVSVEVDLKKNNKKNKKNNRRKKQTKKPKKDISPIKEQLEHSTILENDQPEEREFAAEELEKNLSETEGNVAKQKKKKQKVTLTAPEEGSDEEDESIKPKTRTKNKKTTYKKYYK